MFLPLKQSRGQVNTKIIHLITIIFRFFYVSQYGAHGLEIYPGLCQGC